MNLALCRHHFVQGIVGRPIPSINVRNQAMMLSKFFPYWCDALAHFCWALYFTGRIILLTIPRWKKSHAAVPLIISPSGGQCLCKHTHNIRRKCGGKATWEHFLSHPVSPTAKSWQEHPVHNWRRPAPWISPF